MVSNPVVDDHVMIFLYYIEVLSLQITQMYIEYKYIIYYR